MMQKKLLPIIWGLAILSLLFLSDFFKSKSVHFFGIADDREQMISFQYPVEIVRIFTVEGKKVRQDMKILEVKRGDLTSKIDIIDEEIKTLESREDESNKSIQSQMNSLTAEKNASSATIDLQIHQIELRMQQNQALLEGISGTKRDSNAIAPGMVEIIDLKRKRLFSLKSIDAQVDNLHSQLNSEHRPVNSRIAALREQKLELQRQGSDLKVSAKFSGRISSIHYKPGELVPPFQTVMSVHSLLPRYIKGYIHENILNDVKLGQKVWVSSTTSSTKDSFIQGIVESVGNRIVEYPIRLRKNPVLPAWGREVVVRLKEDHSLLFGEKVDVQLEEPTSLPQRLEISFSDSAGARAIQEIPERKVIRSNDPRIDSTEIEASGILWNAEKEHYLLISDEEIDKSPGVFVMDRRGEITSRLIFSENTRIDDLESISRDGENFFILASLSHNKKGRLKAKRRKLIRFTYNHQGTLKQDEVDLYAVLDRLSQNTPPSAMTRFLSNAINHQTMDIEAHMVMNNNLYLGFKGPLDSQGNTVILELSDINKLFSGQKIEGRIWQTIQMRDPKTGKKTHLSDMLMLKENLLLTSVIRSSQRSHSYLWRYRLQDKNLKKLKTFPDLKLEGISPSSDGKLLMIVFDQGGGEPSQYQFIPFSPK